MQKLGVFWKIQDICYHMSTEIFKIEEEMTVFRSVYCEQIIMTISILCLGLQPPLRWSLYPFPHLTLQHRTCIQNWMEVDG